MDRKAQAAEEARATLTRVARRGSAITYSELVREIEAMPLEPDSKVLAAILDEISRTSNQELVCMLSAVVVHKGSDELPGPGFFALATSLGRDITDKLAFHAAEIARVHAAYARGGR